MMSIDEAIAHAKNIANEQYMQRFLCHANPNDEKLDGCIECAKEHEQLAEWLEELKKYKQLEEQGFLLIPPCKVGDTLHWYDFLGEYHKEFVNCIYVERGLNGIKIETACCQINAEEIGKTVFLTQAEAGEAVKRMKSEE